MQLLVSRLEFVGSPASGIAYRNVLHTVYGTTVLALRGLTLFLDLGLKSFAPDLPSFRRLPLRCHDIGRLSFFSDEKRDFSRPDSSNNEHFSISLDFDIR